MGGKRSEKRGGIRGDASQVAPLSPLEKNSSKVSLKSSNNAKKVDSSVDCHALPSDKARNDNQNGVSKKVDSRENAQNVENSAKDSSSGDLSLRDTAPAVAQQSNSALAESNQINGARKACNLESVQGDWGAKGVKEGGG